MIDPPEPFFDCTAGALALTDTAGTALFIAIQRFEWPPRWNGKCGSKRAEKAAEQPVYDHGGQRNNGKIGDKVSGTS